MGLLSFLFAGGGFILVGAHEALLHVSDSEPKKKRTTLSLLLVTIFSASFIANSLFSLLDAHTSNDAVGFALQLQFLSIALIFLFYSLLPLLLPSLPSSLLALVSAFAFAEEFLLFYLQRKDPSGVENRYYDLLLVPIAVCVFCTLLEWKSPHSSVPKLGRGIGLILQGTWIVQMGLALFSASWVAQGCSLHRVSRGNYTLRCKDHPQYHRARAIATLQFNCHLALLVVFVVSLFAVVGAGGVPRDSSRYAPIGAELQRFENPANFTLDSDDEDEREIPDGDLVSQKAIVAVNGNASPH